jgi:hypothetical protein
MKDFNVNKDQKIEIKEEREVKKELQLVDSAKIVPGLNMFELNMQTFAIKQILPTGKDEHISEKRNLITGQIKEGMTSFTRVRYNAKENCRYVQATNLKNATRKFEKFIVKELKRKLS